MPKKIGVIVLIILVLAVFLTPMKKYIVNLFGKNNKALTEDQIIGTVSGFNPRVKLIQKILEDLDFEVVSVDGRMGSQTRKAIMKFQESKKLAPTGKVDSNTWEELNKQKEEIIKEILNPGVEHEPILEAQDFVNTQDKDDRLSAEKVSQKSQIQDEIMGYRLKSKNRIKQVQTALKKVGFYKGDIDGKLGPQTKRAIKAFQKSKGLAPDGVIGVRTWEELAKILNN